MPEGLENYFDPKYLESRKKVVREFRELAKKEPPAPEKDWEVIWPLTGPEDTFAKAAQAHPGEEHKTAKGYNQTRRRFETALAVVREVTAARLRKPRDEVTLDDIKAHGPCIYWNGKAATNDYLRELIESGKFEDEFHFPGSRIRITDARDIRHTGDQFEKFPQDLFPPEGKVAIVSDLYHLPRVKRTMRKYPDKFPIERSILYPSQPLTLPTKNALREAKNIYLYSKKGILPTEE